MEPALRSSDPLNAEWVTVLLLGSFIMLALINVNSPRKWRLLSDAMFRMRLGRQALREELDLQDRTFIGLLIVAVCVLALFIWQALMLTPILPSFSFLHIMIAVSLVVAFQAVMSWTLALLFGADHGTQEHLYTGLLLFILAGIVLLPLVVLIAYRADLRVPLLGIGTVLLAASLVYRWVRTAWIGRGASVPFGYIFLYLCGAEILPLLLLIHALRPSIPQLYHL